MIKLKTVFEGQILDVISVENGLVIAYIYEQDGNDVNVAYKMVTFDNGKIINVQKSMYELSKFGANYKQAVKHAKTHLSCKTVVLPNGKVFILEKDGSAKLLDGDAEEVWSGNLEYRGEAPSGIAVNNRSVWSCFKSRSVFMRMNVVTMREELRIGGGTSSPFKEPIDLFAVEDDIYVCNAGSNTVLKVNTNSYVTEEYKTFDQNILQFIKNGVYEFAVLENGVYLLD